MGDAFRVDIVLIGLFLLTLGGSLHTAGTVTTSWIVASSRFTGPGVDDGGGIGLFEACDGQGTCVSLEDMPQLQAIQAMCILGILFSGLAGILTAYYILRFFTGEENNILLPVFSLGCSLLASLCIFIGVIVWVVDYFNEEIFEDSYNKLTRGYSFTLCTVGGVIIFTGGMIIMGGALTSLSNQDPKTAYVPPPKQTVYHTHVPVCLSYIHRPDGVDNGKQPGGVKTGQQQKGVSFSDGNYRQRPREVTPKERPRGVNYGKQSGGVSYGQQPGELILAYKEGEVNYGLQPDVICELQPVDVRDGQNLPAFKNSQPAGKMTYDTAITVK